MKYKFEKIFKKNQAVVIGAIHLSPLLGYPDFPGADIAFKNALTDLKAFEEGGVDAVIIENNYDIPHKKFVDTKVASSFLELAKKIENETDLPVGVSVLWNDYITALKIAKTIGADFIRVPVFVDTVKTSCGTIIGNPEEIVRFRNKIKANNIALFTDIHVKHSEIISQFSIEESAQLAIKHGSDGLIITGKWTGDAPNITELASVRKTVGGFPILCGSGVDDKNILKLFKYADGAIVSTSLKSGVNDASETNVKPYSARIDLKKVQKLISIINQK